MTTIYLSVIIFFLCLALISEQNFILNHSILFRVLKFDLFIHMMTSVCILFAFVILSYFFRSITLWITGQFMVIGLMLAFSILTYISKTSGLSALIWSILCAIACINSVSEKQPKFSYDEENKCFLHYVRENINVETKAEFLPYMTLYKIFLNQDDQKYYLSVTHCINSTAIQKAIKNPGISEKQKAEYLSLLNKEPITQEFSVTSDIRN
jgi:hypothetical protein